jgi:hypothetical protein
MTIKAALNNDQFPVKCPECLNGMTGPDIQKYTDFETANKFQEKFIENQNNGFLLEMRNSGDLPQNRWDNGF